MGDDSRSRVLRHLQANLLGRDAAVKAPSCRRSGLIPPVSPPGMTPAIGYPTRAAFTAAYDTVSPRFGTGLNRRVILPLLDPIDLLRRQERLMRGYGLKLQELPVDLPAEPW